MNNKTHTFNKRFFISRQCPSSATKARKLAHVYVYASPGERCTLTQILWGHKISLDLILWFEICIVLIEILLGTLLAEFVCLPVCTWWRRWLQRFRRSMIRLMAGMRSFSFIRHTRARPRCSHNISRHLTPHLCVNRRLTHNSVSSTRLPNPLASWTTNIPAPALPHDGRTEPSPHDTSTAEPSPTLLEFYEPQPLDRRRTPREQLQWSLWNILAPGKRNHKSSRLYVYLSFSNIQFDFYHMNTSAAMIAELRSKLRW